MGIFGMGGNGVYLQQLKEPTLSREIRTFFNTSAPPPRLARPPADSLGKLDSETIVRTAREARIIDERDGKPLYKKLMEGRRNPIDVVIADAIDDEPYLSSQLAPLLHMRKEVAEGLRAAAKAVASEHMQVVIYKNMYNINTRLPKQLDGIPVVHVGGKYPVEVRANIVSRGKRGLIVGAGALIHLYRALYEGRMHATCFVTVAGNCVATPTNLEVAIGMTANQVLERCGLLEDPTRVVIGGPMTGIAVIDTDKTSISPTTRGVLAFRDDEKDRHYRCINCGRCVSVCPQNLNPMAIHKAVTMKKYSALTRARVEDCIGCGTCSYVCPAKLNISSVITGYQEKITAKPTTGQEVKKVAVNPA